MNIGLDAIIENLVKEFIKPISTKIVEMGNTQYEKALVLLERSFIKYLKRSHERYSKIKTLLYRDQPVSLRDHYVVSDFKIGKTKIIGEEILALFIQKKRNIVVGTAGSGKSVLLRKIFLDLVESRIGFAPILVELRLLESLDDSTSIFGYILKIVSDLDRDLSVDQLDFAMQRGKVVLLLDGYDEIDYSKREAYEREILELSQKYSELVIVLSSRPDDCFSSWDEFYTFKVLPLSCPQALELISKIDYDQDVKSKFIGELTGGLYSRHSDFLSNPLLLTMMLLTYEQLAEIPEKIHIFYDQAFDTLFHKHDALKSLYKRKSYTEMPIDDFKKLFSAFCILSYIDRKISFSDAEILEYIRRANELEGFGVDSTKYFNDLVKSVCIIRRDGNSYTFTHRSFQEYFASCFISRSQSLDFRSLLDVISVNIFRDSVIETLFEINRDRLETVWIIPKLRDIIPVCKKTLEDKKYAKFLNIFFGSIGIFDDGIGFTFEKDKNGYFFNFLSKLYKNEFDSFSGVKNLSEDERDKRGRQEAEALAENLNIEENENVKLLGLDSKLDWCRGTEIPQYCQRKYDFMNYMLSSLSEKYETKEQSLRMLIEAGIKRKSGDSRQEF